MSRVYLSPPDIGALEHEFVLRALHGGWIAPIGPDLDAFEAEMAAVLGWQGVVGLASGTAALHLGLLTLGVGPGDEVLSSTFTFAATANAITYCGASPGFIDSDTLTWNLSPSLLADELSDRARRNALPKAVVVVDLYGQCADYDPIVAMCRDYGVSVIEDAAEALFATYKQRPAGTLADLGVLSFNGNKIMTTSGGGMFLSPSIDAADRVRYLATQARQPAMHYEHTEVGFNYRLSNLLAALGRAQLQRLPAMSARRREINDLYRLLLGELPELTFMPISPWGQWNGWLTCVVFADSDARSAVQRGLDDQDIESRPLWKPLHLQPVFKRCASRLDGTSEGLFRHGLCLPSGSVLTDEQVARVADVIRETLRARL